MLQKKKNKQNTRKTYTDRISGRVSVSTHTDTNKFV